MRSDVRPCNFYLVPVKGRLAAVKRGAVMTLVEYFEAKWGRRHPTPNSSR